MMRIGLLSDTHGRLHPDIAPRFKGVDAIVHAGDVCDDDILKTLGRVAPVHAVCGNMDAPSVALPLMRTVPFAFGNLCVAHGHEFPRGKEQRSRALHQAFQSQEPRVILFGHSHQQYMEFYKDAFLINPGAAGLPRFNLQSSFAILEWDAETRLFHFEFIPVKW